jgi:uncharacterized protein YjgD (DUF1641 family)
MILNEDNKEIEDIIKYLNSRIVELRESGKLKPNSEFNKELEIIYNKWINPWYEHIIFNQVETDKETTEIIINRILSVVSFLKSIK